MKRQIVLRPQAQDDIDKIWDYSAEQWDMDQADAYVGDIRAAIRFIATGPFIGTDCAHLARITKIQFWFACDLLSAWGRTH